MSRLSQTHKIAQLLMNRPGERLTARQLAELLLATWPEEYAEKRANERFADDHAFIAQLVAEIGAQKSGILRYSQAISWQDKPRPRVYWFDPINPPSTGLEVVNSSEDTEVSSIIDTLVQPVRLSEYDLYPLLMDYLHSEHGLYCLRIDERRSPNARGRGGNHWLHPDIVALHPVAHGWHETVRTCVLQGGGQAVRLWSFEVKKTLTTANVRECYFQAVSNSSWANAGYLVCLGVEGRDANEELRMLSALHGIGVIILNPENPSESEIMLPARNKEEVDWQSVNRLVRENDDMRQFAELVATYYQTGRLNHFGWHHQKNTKG